MNRILVVDDEKSLLRALGVHLRARGYDVDLVETGEAALARAATEVVACRQPAFGLGCMALAASGFDSGIGTTERFDFTTLTRPSPKDATGSRPGRGGRRGTIYLPQLTTSVPYPVADAILSVSGLTGSFVCTEPCCRDNVRDVLHKGREHFVYSRLREIRDLKRRPSEWRAEQFSQCLIVSRQMSEKVLRAFPDGPVTTFRYLDVWSRVMAAATDKTRRVG